MSEQFEVRSRDGTVLAVWIVGEGPPLLMVHGATGDHSSDAALIEELARHMAVFAMDRRGRGGSADGPDYSIWREFEDVAAVADAVLGRTEQRPIVWGHSYGADCVLGAATLTTAMAGLVLYEPGLGMSYPPGSVEAVADALAAGDAERAVIALLSEVVELSPAEVDHLRSLPTWPRRLEAVPTVPRELEAESRWAFAPGQFAAVRVPVLVLAGGDSPPEQESATRRAADALATSRIHVLDGHGHIAHRTDPGLVAGVIRRFAASVLGTGG